MDQITAAATIVGIVNLVKMQFPIVTGIFGLALALAIGVVMGFFGFLVPDVQMGVITALASSGIYVIAQRAGGK